MFKLQFLRFVILVLFYSSSAWSDYRSYAYTYEFVTMPKGKAELEFYNGLTVPDTKDSTKNTWKQQLEIEYGITDIWDISLYQVYKQTTAGIKYDEMKIRTRYKLISEPGSFFVDPLIYVEYKMPSDLSYSKGELKLILARDFDKINLSFNYITEGKLASGSIWDNKYAFGMRYQFSPAFKLGIEATGYLTDKNKHNLGPVISFASGDIWIAIGAGSGLTDASDKLVAQSIIGIGF